MALAKQPSTRAVTLGDLVRSGRSVWAYCLDCFRERDLAAAILPLPQDLSVPEIARRLKCMACGSRRVQTKPQLHDKPVSEVRRIARSKQSDA